MSASFNTDPTWHETPHDPRMGRREEHKFMEHAAWQRARNEAKVIRAIHEGMSHLPTIQKRSGLSRSVVHRTLRDLCDPSAGVLTSYPDYRGREVYVWAE